MKLKIIIPIVLFTFSCKKDTEYIYYNYNGVTITRIDESTKSIFYYGKCNRIMNNCPDSYIIANYNGSDGLMSGYLVFEKNKKIKLIRIADSFEQIGNDTLLNIYEFNNNFLFNKWKDSIENNYNNIVQISNIIKTEKFINEKNNSKVDINYLR